MPNYKVGMFERKKPYHAKLFTPPLTPPLSGGGSESKLHDRCLLHDGIDVKAASNTKPDSSEPSFAWTGEGVGVREVLLKS